MAVDEVLLTGLAAPCAHTLRFYAWNRPTLSVGYSQKWREAFDPAVAESQRLGVVRRPTGGRTVLHADELTYALCGPIECGILASSVVDSYRQIALGLSAGLALLGAEVELARPARHRGGKRAAACFASRSRHELLHRGRKLVGSAQRRRGDRLLQHGSIPLGAPERRIWRALGSDAETALESTIGIAEVLGARPSGRLLVAALTRGIAETLGLSPRPGRLTRREAWRAQELASRYRDPEWTRRR